MVNDKQKLATLGAISLIEKTSGHGESSLYISFNDDNGNRHYETIRTLLLKPSVKDGWKLVPVEPTREMDNAWHSALPCPFHVAYKAMISAVESE